MQWPRAPFHKLWDSMCPNTMYRQVSFWLTWLYLTWDSCICFFTVQSPSHLPSRIINCKTTSSFISHPSDLHMGVVGTSFNNWACKRNKFRLNFNHSLTFLFSNIFNHPLQNTNLFLEKTVQIAYPTLISYTFYWQNDLWEILLFKSLSIPQIPLITGF